MPHIASMDFDINGRTSGLYQLPCDGLTSVTATARFVLEWSAAEFAAAATRQIRVVLTEPGVFADTDVITVIQPTAATDPALLAPVIGLMNPGLATSVYTPYPVTFAIRCSVACELLAIDAVGRIGIHGDNDADFTFKILAPFPGPYYANTVSVECTTLTTGVFYIPASAITNSPQYGDAIAYEGKKMPQAVSPCPGCAQKPGAIGNDQQAFKDGLLVDMNRLLNYRLSILKSELQRSSSTGFYLEPDPPGSGGYHR
jgi:hypothetical protein